MVSFIRKENTDGSYLMECGLEDVNLICNEEKGVPAQWITENGSDISDEFIKYITPLVQGNITVPAGDDGLPVFVYRK